MHFRISGVLGDQDAIKTLEKEIIDQLNEEAEEKYKKLLAENAKSSASSNTTLSPPEKITTLSQETLLSKIMERFGAKGTDNKLFHHKAASINDEADNFRFKAKNISQGRLSGKRRYIYTFLSIDGINYIYVLKDDPDHRPDKTKYANPDFNLQNYFEKPKVKANLKAQLLKISNSKVDATKHIETTADKSDFKALPIETHLFNGELYKLTEDQQKALLTETPCGYLGSAGSGKTLVSDIALDYENNKGNYVVYIEQNDKLRFERETDHRKNYPNCNADFSNYGNLLWSLELKKPENERRRFITKDEYALKIKELIEIINKKGFNLTEQDFIKETRVLFGYDRNEYLALGPKESHFGGNDDKYKINLREALWEAGSNLLDYLDREHLMHPDITQLPKDSLPAIIVDEAQNLTLAQLKSLFYAAKGRNIRFIFDNNQMLLDQMRHKIEFLKKLANKHGITINICELKENLRSSIPVTNLGNNVLDVVNQLYREGRNSNIEGNPEKKGNIIWLPIKQTHESNLCTLTSNSIDTAVIVLPEFIDEAAKKFGKDKVYTVDEIQGLQYKNIILYRMFDGKEHKEEFEFAAKILEQGIPAEKNKDIKAHLIWNHLYTAVTRAEGCVIVYQDFKAQKNKHLKPLYDKLRYDRIKNEVTPYVEANVNVLTLIDYTLKNAENCKALAEKLIIEAKAKLLADEPDLISAASLENKAKLVYREYLNFEGNKLDDASFESTFKQFSMTINLSKQIKIEKKQYTGQNESTGEPSNTNNAFNPNNSTQQKNSNRTNARKKNLQKKRKKAAEAAKLIEIENAKIIESQKAGVDEKKKTVEAGKKVTKKTEEVTTSLTKPKNITEPPKDQNVAKANPVAPQKQSNADHLAFLLNNFSSNNLKKLFDLKNPKTIATLFLNIKIKYNYHDQSLFKHIAVNDAYSKYFLELAHTNLEIIAANSKLLSKTILLALEHNDLLLIQNFSSLIIEDTIKIYVLDFIIKKSNNGEQLRKFLNHFNLKNLKDYSIPKIGGLALTEAILTEDESKVKVILDQGVNPNTVLEAYNMTALRFAMHIDKSDDMIAICHTLLKKDSQIVNIKDEDGQTPLAIALKDKKPSYVKLFLIADGSLDPKFTNIPNQDPEITQMLEALRFNNKIPEIFCTAIKNNQANVIDFILRKYPEHILKIKQSDIADIFNNHDKSVIETFKKVILELIDSLKKEGEEFILEKCNALIHLILDDNEVLSSIYLIRGNQHFSNGDQHAAISDYTTALNLTNVSKTKLYILKSRAKTHVLLAEREKDREKQEIDYAIADFNEILTFPELGNKVPMLMKRGLCFKKINNYAQAIEDFSNALKLSNTPSEIIECYTFRSTDYFLSNKYDSAITDIFAILNYCKDKTIELSNSKKISLYLNLAKNYHAKDELDNIFYCIDQIAKLNPNEEQQQKLQVYFNLQNNRGETALEQAIRLENATIVKLILLTTNGLPDESLLKKVRNKEISHMFEAIKNPNKVPALIKIACNNNMANLFDFLLMKYQDEIIKINHTNLHQIFKPLQATSHFTLINLLEKHVDKCLAKGKLVLEKADIKNTIHELNYAIHLLECVPEEDNKLSELYALRAAAYFTDHQDDKVVADYTEALKLAPTEKLASYLYNRGMAYIRMSQFDKAISDFNQVLKEMVDKQTKLKALIAKGDACTAKKDNHSARDAYLNARSLALDDNKLNIDLCFKLLSNPLHSKYEEPIYVKEIILVDYKQEYKNKLWDLAVQIGNVEAVKHLLTITKTFDSSLDALFETNKKMLNAEIYKMWQAVKDNNKILDIFVSACKDGQAEVLDFIVTKFPYYLLNFTRDRLQELYINAKESGNVRTQKFIENIKDKFIEQSFDHLKDDNMAEAILKYTLAINFYPNISREITTNLYEIRATVYNETKQYDKEADDYTKALEYVSDTKKQMLYYYSRGKARLRVKNFYGAISDFNEVLKTCDNNDIIDDIYLCRANAYTETKDHNAAIVDYSYVIKGNFSNEIKVKAHIARGSTYVILEDHDKAILDLLTAIRLTTNTSEQIDFYIMLATIHLSRKDKDSMNNCIQEALNRGPNEEQKLKLRDRFASVTPFSFFKTSTTLATTSTPPTLTSEKAAQLQNTMGPSQ